MSYGSTEVPWICIELTLGIRLRRRKSYLEMWPHSILINLKKLSSGLIQM